jgi:hypothetical protein
MPSSGILQRVALVRTDFSEEPSASIIRVTRIGLLVTANVVPNSPILVALMMGAIRSSETPVVTRAIRPNIPEYGILRIWFVLRPHLHVPFVFSLPTAQCYQGNVSLHFHQSSQNSMVRCSRLPPLIFRQKWTMDTECLRASAVRLSFRYRSVQRTEETRKFHCGKVGKFQLK